MIYIWRCKYPLASNIKLSQSNSWLSETGFCITLHSEDCGGQRSKMSSLPPVPAPGVHTFHNLILLNMMDVTPMVRSHVIYFLQMQLSFPIS